MSKTITFSAEAEHAIDLVKNSDKNLFITGKAGTGKSTLLEHIVANYGEDMVVLAPTGIAAIHVKGETLHSFFRLKPGYELDEAKHMRIPKNRVEKYKEVRTLLIDEISMVRADVLDAVDVFLKRSRKSQAPFGGVRMIFFGDLHQLPPVITNDEIEAFSQNYKSPWFFSAQVFQALDLFMEGFKQEKIELTKIYRQSDPDFIEKLNAVRDGLVTQAELDYFDGFLKPDFEAHKDENWVNLVATNAQAYRINAHKLAEIPQVETAFTAFKEGNIGRLQPNDEKVFLKEGAQVMFIQNDTDKRFVNGTIGSVKTISKVKKDGDEETLVTVTLDNGKEIQVGKHTWPISKYQFKQGKFVREEIGSFTQLPLKLAWAITIHKSQGKTFDKVILDLGNGGFAHGQTYVALSRCTSPEGLVLKKALRFSDVIVDERIMIS